MWEECDPERRYERGGRHDSAKRRRELRLRKMRKKKRRRKALKFIACLAVVILVSTVILGAKDRISDAGWLGSLLNPAVEEVMQHKEEYPDELVELVRNNEETAEFVLDYPEKKDLPPAETVGDIQAGEIPLLLQWDERWGYCTYGDGMIAVNGCGPTAVAMVAAGLTGDHTVTPYRVAQYSADNGYYAGDSGTSWTLMTEGAEHFGIHGEETGLDRNEIFSALEAGHPIICSMRPGDFTTTGHFIVLTGIEDGKIRVNDPNSRKRSEKLWDYDRLEYQINNLWTFTVQ